MWAALVLAVVVAGAAFLVWKRTHRRPAPRVSTAKPGAAAAAPAKKLPVNRPPGAPASASPAAPAIVVPEIFPRAAKDVLEAQIELARRGLSSGSIDGVLGGQTGNALRAFQNAEGLAETGVLDRATKAALLVGRAPLAPFEITAADLAGLQPLSPTWLGKSEQSALAHETALELAAERTHAHPELLKKLNPELDWNNVAAGTAVLAPAIGPLRWSARAAHVRIFLADHVLEARDADEQLLFHCPVSIASNVEKRPVGELHVSVVAPDPNYTFNPEVFPESAEAQEIGRKLILAPGPNNPVGVAWIGLDLPGYGIHGTPRPEQVGRTESHGCFRVANWDARALLDLVWSGLPVTVEP